MSAAVGVVDLRYFLIPIINMLKPLVSADSWDPFTILGDPTWSKICLALALAAFLSFVSVSPSSSSPVFEFRPRSFSPRFCFSYLASLILPQLLFCYLYPTILLLSTDLAVAVFLSFGRSLQTLLSSMRGFNVHIAPHRANSDGPDLEMGEGGSSRPPPPPSNSDG